MSKQQTSITIEIPSAVPQQEIWNFEKQLQSINGVVTELQEPRDLITATLLFLHLVAPIIGPVAEIGGGIKALYEVAKIIYDFSHSSKKEKNVSQGKKHMVIIKNKKRIELDDLSIEEIEKLLKNL